MPTVNTRAMLIALLLQSVLACDATAPLNPTESAGRVVSDPSRSVASPGIAAAAVSAREIDVSWGADSHADGYQLFRSTTGSTGNYALRATTVTARAYADTGLTPATQYCYEVRSFRTPGKNTVYAGFSSPACAMTLVPPVAAPSEVHAAPDSSRILITWKDNSANEDGFHIEQALGASGPWTQLASASANATSTFANPGPEYPACYRVTAFNAVGTSIPAAIACTVLPQYPGLLSAKPLDQQSLTVKWADNSAFEDGYEVFRLDATGIWAMIATVPANTTTYRDANVTLDAVYKYRVRATKDGGYSEISNEVNGIIPTTVPADPTNLVTYLTGNPFDGSAYFAIGWTDASTNEEGFRVEFSYDGVTDWRLAFTVEANVTGYEESGFYAPGPYCYRVFAFNALGDSQPTNVSCAVYDNSQNAAVARPLGALRRDPVRPEQRAALRQSGHPPQGHR